MTRHRNYMDCTVEGSTTLECKYYRNYDPRIISNKFAIGECIEWVDGIYQSECNDTLCVSCAAGVVRKITPYAVVIDIRYPRKKRGEVRIAKSQLAQDVIDWKLGETIATTLGETPSPKRIKKTAPQIKNPIPHDVYRLRDPRDKSVFYVGISKNSQRRYKQHLACVGLNFNLNLRIQEILQNGFIPEMEIIERAIPGVTKAREYERFWINHHIRQGDPLTNIAEVEVEA